MKKFTFFAFAIGISMLMLVTAKAQTYTIDGVYSGTTQLSGASAGNKQSFDVDLNLTSLSQNLIINSATLQFYTTGTSNLGDVKILDKYKPISTSLIDLISLGTAGTKQSTNILTSVKDWYANSLTNYGVSFYSKDFGDTDNVSFSGIQLIVDASTKDTVPPVFLRKDVIKSDLDVYKFIIETDELTKVVVNIGKTSIYDQKSADEVSYLTSREIAFSGLQNGVTYHYQITATDQSGNITKSTDNTFLTSVVFQTQTGSYVQDTTLLPPNNLSQELAKKAGKYSAILTWTPSISDGIDGYVVFRKTSDSNNYVELVKLSPATLSYQDDSVETGLVYDYQINSYKGNKISSDGATVSVEIPADTSTDSSSKPQTTYNTGQVLLILFAVAVIIYIIVYLVIKFFPKIVGKKSGKDPLKNILNDPVLFEGTVASEFGSKTETEYPLEDPIPGNDMN